MIDLFGLAQQSKRIQDKFKADAAAAAAASPSPDICKDAMPSAMVAICRTTIDK